jgi:hypothetical protein
MSPCTHWSADKPGLARSLAGGFLVLIFLLAPAAVSDTEEATFHVLRGSAWHNGASVSGSTAVVPGDSIEVLRDSSGNLTTTGSSVTIGADSLVHYQLTGIVLDHGKVTVRTGKRLAVEAENVTVTPYAEGTAEYEVTDRSGSVEIAARSGNLRLGNCRNGEELKQGSTYTCQPKKGAGKSSAHKPLGPA